MIDNIILLLLTTGNKSSGALDNACGMTCVFEIARYFREHPLNSFNVWCCQFGAEELGTMGSRNFCKTYEDQFVIGKIFQNILLQMQFLPDALNLLIKNIQ